MSSRAFIAVGLFCLIASAVLASLAFTGTLTWGYRRGARYLSSFGPVQTILTGRRLMETNNGALAIPIFPLAATGLICISAALQRKPVNNTSNFLSVVWVSALISFPIYAIVFVNMLYDAGIQGAARPFIVMLLPLVLTLLFYGLKAWETKGHNP